MRKKAKLIAKALIKLAIFIIVLPILKIISYFGTGAIRRRNGTLQAPIVTYKHKKTEKSLVLVSTIHVAEGAYFHFLQEIINMLDAKGYVVLYERVKKTTTEERSGFSQKEEGIFEQMQIIFRGISKLKEAVELEHQNTMDYKEHWINTDMSQAELIKELAERNAPILGKKFKESDVEFDKAIKENRKLTVNIMKYIYGKLDIIILIFAFVAFIKGKNKAKKVIVDRIDRIGVEGIMKYGAENDVVSIWGAAHLKGMGALLRYIGYKEIEKKWVAFYHVK